MDDIGVVADETDEGSVSCLGLGRCHVQCMLFTTERIEVAHEEDFTPVFIFHCGLLRDILMTAIGVIA